MFSLSDDDGYDYHGKQLSEERHFAFILTVITTSIIIIIVSISIR